MYVWCVCVCVCVCGVSVCAVLSLPEVNFDLEGMFVQEFIANPLLIAGR